MRNRQAWRITARIDVFLLDKDQNPTGEQVGFTSSTAVTFQARRESMVPLILEAIATMQHRLLKRVGEMLWVDPVGFDSFITWEVTAE